jgi:hypothetical protein
MPRELPNIAEIIGPILQRLPAAERPLLGAVAERLAAERYRGWAAAASDAAWRAALLACAAREEDIAGRVERSTRTPPRCRLASCATIPTSSS